MKLPDVRSILIKPHASNKQYLAPVDKAGERAIYCSIKLEPFSSALSLLTLFAPRGHSRPVAEVALCGVVSLEHVPITALKS